MHAVMKLHNTAYTPENILTTTERIINICAWGTISLNRLQTHYYLCQKSYLVAQQQ